MPELTQQSGLSSSLIAEKNQLADEVVRLKLDAQAKGAELSSVVANNESKDQEIAKLAEEREALVRVTDELVTAQNVIAELSQSKKLLQNQIRKTNDEKLFDQQLYEETEQKLVGVTQKNHVLSVRLTMLQQEVAQHLGTIANLATAHTEGEAWVLTLNKKLQSTKEAFDSTSNELTLTKAVVEKLQTNLTAAEKQLADYRALADANRKLAEADQKLEEANQSNAMLTGGLESAKAVFDSTTRELTTAQELVATLSREKEVLQKQVTDAESRHSQELQAYEQQKQALSQEMVELKAGLVVEMAAQKETIALKLESLQSQLDAAQKSSDEFASKLKKQDAVFVARKNELKTTINSKEEELNTVQEKIQTLMQEHACALAAEVSSKQQAITELRQEGDKVKVVLAEKETIINNLNDVTKLLEAQITNLQSQLELNSKTDQEDHTEQKMATQKQMIEALNKQKDELNKQVMGLSSKVAELNVQLDVQKALVQKHVEESLAQAMDDTAPVLARHSSDIQQNLSREISHLQQGLNDKESELAEKDAVIKALRKMQSISATTVSVYQPNHIALLEEAMNDVPGIMPLPSREWRILRIERSLKELKKVVELSVL